MAENESDFGLSEKHIKSINAVFLKFGNVQKAILYGSRAKGTFPAGSDLDLTLIGTDLNFSALAKIENELDELNLPYMIDLSNFNQIENPDLVSHIKRVGKVFFERL